MESHIFVINTSCETYQYTVQYPHDVSLPIVWMRSVHRDLLKMNIPKSTREQFFLACKPCDHDATADAWNISTFNKRLSVKMERDVGSWKRVSYKVVKTSKALITREESNKRVRKAAVRSAKRMKAAQEIVNQSVAPILCYGLLRTEAKYQRAVRLNNALRSGPASYGIRLALQPTVSKVKKIADAIYTSPALLTNIPDWTLRYRRGRLHAAGEHLALPNQKVSVTNIDYETYPRYEDLDNAIIEKLQQVRLEVIATKIRIGEVLEKKTIAAIVYLQSAYHARAALKPLSHFGRVHLGQTVATPRIVASKVKPTIQMLLTEADGCAADERLTVDQCQSFTSQVDPINLSLQIWLDKDGRVSFIKIKIIDLSCTVFKHGHSRVAYLLEYIGDENECRQFIPPLVDEFAESNAHIFHLLSGLPVFVRLVYITSDHKALFALTGRSGGNEWRDLFCRSLASKYHLVLHQGQTSFKYDNFIKLWEKINAEMKLFKDSLLHQNRACTNEMETNERNRLYREHGRIDRVPAFMYGVSRARPEVTDLLVITPLNLHNDTYANITTMTLLLEITDSSPELRRKQAMWKGLMDGFGQTKCATSGEGIRRLVNECLCLAGSIKAPHTQRFSPLWWLKDTISRHLRLTTIKDGQPSALTDHERLKFAVTTLLWWLLLGDLSDLQGGRTLKSGVKKNHLQDKIYPFELATACVDFEEVSNVPLSLLNESFFEATFTYRDEMINTFHTKVGLDKERKGKFFSDTLNQLVPNIKYRSHIGQLDRHQNRQIMICGCWTQNNKWSLNIKRRLLYRSVTLSYRDRISICPSGTYKHAIKIDTYPSHQGTGRGFYANQPPPPPLFVDQCGLCDTSGMRDVIFTRTLMTWNSMKTIYHKISMGRLGRSYLQRIRTVNRRRALRIKQFITSEIKKETCNVMTVQRAYDGYCLLQRGWPQHIRNLRVTARLQEILDTTPRSTGKVWDGDLATLPDVHLLNMEQLKEVIRFYKIRQVEKGIVLKGNKVQLVQRASTLIQRYGAISQDN